MSRAPIARASARARARRGAVARRGASRTGRGARVSERLESRHTDRATPATGDAIASRRRARRLFATRATRTWCVTSSERRKTTRTRTTRAPSARDGSGARRADARGGTTAARAAIATTRGRAFEGGRARCDRRARGRRARTKGGYRAFDAGAARGGDGGWEGDGRAMGGRGASPRVDDGANATRGGLTETFYRRSRPTRLSR